MALPTTPTDTLDQATGAGVSEATTSTTTGEPTVNELTIYDTNMGCYVLNPKAFTEVINAFHPDYVKTYMPNFLTSIKTEAQMKLNGEKVAKTTPMKMHIIRPAHLHRPKLEPTEFHIYNKAGMPKKGKKK